MRLLVSPSGTEIIIVVSGHIIVSASCIAVLTLLLKIVGFPRQTGFAVNETLGLG